MIRLKKQRGHFKNKGILFSNRSTLNLRGLIKLIIVVFLLAFIGIGLVSLKYMFVDSESFLIKAIDIRLCDVNGNIKDLPLNDIDGKSIVGTNIFLVNLEDFREKVELSHPEFKDIVVKRILPNKFIVEASERKAIAQIRSDRYYPVDEEGVLLPDVKNFPDQNLPIISGIGINLAKGHISEFTKENLKKSLSLIEEMRSIEGLSQYKVKIVDITDPGNITFFLESINVEIKIGNSDFSNRLSLLATLIGQLNSDISRFKYIDLRFDDPILGPR